MADLTERQVKILKAVIDEFVETAMPVGSETLEKKFNLGVSPATIRNEMVKLDKEGFLKQTHTSSGRTPTPIALKYYVSNLMKQENLTVTEEVAVKEKVWDYRSKFERLLQEATRELASRTKLLSISTTKEGDFYSSGAGNILESPEFFDIDLTRAILSCLDRYDYWQGLVQKVLEGDDPIHILLGEELGTEIFGPCSFIYTNFLTDSRSGVIGVVGPSRLKYSKIIPLVKYFGDLIQEIGRD